MGWLSLTAHSLRSLETQRSRIFFIKLNALRYLRLCREKLIGIKSNGKIA